MNSRGWKTTIGVLAIGIVFILWGALNVRTGVLFNWGSSGQGGDDPGFEFITRAEHPEPFWWLVSFKFFVGTLLLLILANAHWKRWQRRAEQRKLEQ